MDLLEEPPPATATQILHDETQKSKPNAETIKTSINTKENIASSKKVTATTMSKNKKQKSISDLVTLKKGKFESVNNNKEHEGQDDNAKKTIQQRRIEHATTATIENNRFTTKCTLDIRPEKKNDQINAAKVHQKIFEAIKNTDDTAVIITHNKTRIQNSNIFPTDEEYKTLFPEQRLCKITKRMYISFTLESELTLSQLKHGSKYNYTTGIIETLRENHAFIKMEKYNSQKEASIGFFLGINPKLTLRTVLKHRIDEICLWLDLDDEDTKKLIKETTSDNKTTQELVIPAFDIHNKEFGSGTGKDRLTSNVYELRTSPDSAAILKNILCKASHPDNNPTIQFIPYGIQGITNKDIYKTLIKKQNAFISESSIIPIYDVEERDVNKFRILIKKTMYIQDIEETHESKTKGKYFLITTKVDYRKALTEANDMIKYIYPERSDNNYNLNYQRNNIPTIHNVVSSYAQVVAAFHDSNPVPAQASQKRLKLHFNSSSIPEKITLISEIPQVIQKNNLNKSVTFNNVEDQPNYQRKLDAFGTPPKNITTPPNYSEVNQVNGKDTKVQATEEEEPDTSFQGRIQQPGNPHRNTTPPTNLHNPTGRSGAYARYGGGRGGRGSGRGTNLFPRQSSNLDKGSKSVATLETQEDTTLDSESDISENWKDQMSSMMKDLRESIMVDVKDLVNENMKEFMREITMNLRNDITATIKETMTTKNNNSTMHLTPNSQPEPITQDTPQQTPRVEELNNLIDEMDIEKSPNKRKAPTSSEEKQDQEDQEETEDTNSDPTSKTRSGTRKSRLNKTLPKGPKS